MKTKILNIVIALVLVLGLSLTMAVPAVAADEIRTVGPGQTFSTIDAAIASLAAEYPAGSPTFTQTEVIEVYDGTYNTGSAGAVADLGANSNRYFRPTSAYKLYLQAAPNNHPVIDATGLDVGIRVDGPDYVTISGFSVENSHSYGIQLSGNYLEAFGNTVEATGDYGIRSHPDSSTTPTDSLSNNSGVRWI